MGRLFSSGFELNSTGGSVEFDSSTNFTIQSTVVRSGTYAAQANASNVQATLRQILFTSNQAAKGWFRIYIRIASYPTAAIRIMEFEDTANATLGGILLNTTGTLALRKADTTTIATSGALALNTWYRVELATDATGSGTLQARIDGATFASGANSSQGSWARVAFGGFGQSSTFNIYIDDVAVNDATGSFQNSWPGDGKIIHLRPNAAGDSNGFLTQVGGTAGAANNYTRVNEVTPDDATSYNGSALLSAEDLFNCDNSGLSSTDTVNLVAVGVRFADITAADATASFKVEVIKTSAGTKSQSAAIIPNSTTWHSNAPATPWKYPLTLYQDPDSANWTNTTLDSMQIGYIDSAINVRVVAISTEWVLVD